jgi:DDE superfamily endonuclease
VKLGASLGVARRSRFDTMGKCCRIGCNAPRTRENPHRDVPIERERRKAWLLKIREGSEGINAYIADHLHTDKYTLSLCLTHFHPKYTTPPTKLGGRHTFADDMVPWSQKEEKLYREQRKSDVLTEVKLQASVPNPEGKKELILRRRSLTVDVPKQHFEIEVATLQRDLQTHKEENVRLSSLITASKEREDAIVSECSQLRAEARSAAEEASDARARCKTSEHARVRAETEKEKAVRNLARANEEISVLKGQVSYWKGEAEKAQKETKYVTARARKELDNARREIADAQNGAKRALSQQGRAETERDAAVSEAKCAVTEKNEAVAQRDVLSREKGRLQTAFDTYKRSSLPVLDANVIMKDDETTRLFSGFLTVGAFKLFILALLSAGVAHAYEGFYFLEKNGKELLRRRSGPDRALNFPNAVALTLTKLRLDFPFWFMGLLFNVKEDLARTTFHFTVGLLEGAITMPPFVPPLTREAYRRGSFECFRKYFPGVALILDCTEFFLQTPTDPLLRSRAWSEYKHHYTLKVLVGMLPNGKTAFVSLCYGGRISDKELTRICKVLSMLWEGAEIMVDKGFTIMDLCREYNVSIVMPPLLTSGYQFSNEELDSGRNIAAARIHIERLNRKAKEFLILTHEVPITMAPHYSTIVRLIFFLCNWTGDIVISPTPSVPTVG